MTRIREALVTKAKWRRLCGEGPIKFELCLMFIIKESWKKKAQKVKHRSNFTNAASKS